MLQVEANDVQRRILNAGKSAELAAAFRCVAEVTSPEGGLRYTARTSAALATMIVCRTYAGAVFQLCHLVNAADACGGYERFLFGPSRARASSYEGYADRTLETEGWRRDGFARTDIGMAISYAEGPIEISFARMPLLAAFFDFLTTALSYRDIDDIFTDMLAGDRDRAGLKHAMQSIERLLYRYLGEHLPSVQHHEIFRQILAYLLEEAKEGLITIDDGAVMSFWRTRSIQAELGNFRLFRSVFAGFIRFARALEWTRTREAVDGAYAFDPDRDAKPDETVGLETVFDGVGEKSSPLDVLDDEPVRQIKFLTKRERRELAPLMDAGAFAERLPLSVLRGEVFGARQFEITQALRAKSASSTISKLASCDGCTRYADTAQHFRDLRQLMQRICEAASFIALRSPRHAEADNVISLNPIDPSMQLEHARTDPPKIDDTLLTEAMERARTAFRNVSRRGFEHEIETDPERLEAFKVGAGALLTGREMIDEYLVTLEKIDRGETDLDTWFIADQAAFSTQFQQLYGDRTDASDI